MSITPRSLCFVALDVSHSMAAVQPVVTGVHPAQSIDMHAPVELAKDWIRTKYGQRLLRELATTPFGVVSFPASRTRNVLSTMSKARPDYDKSKDPYRHFYVNLSIEPHLDPGRLARITEIAVGAGPKVDERNDEGGYMHYGAAESALSLSLMSVVQHPNCDTYQREIVLITDGLSPSMWTEDFLESMVDEYSEKNMSLHVIGVHFEDDELLRLGVDAAKMGEIWNTNRDQLRSFVERLNAQNLEAYEEKLLHDPLAKSTPVSTFTSLARALVAIHEPHIKVVNSVPLLTQLTIGDSENEPDTSIVIDVEIRKSIMAATGKTQKKMSLEGFYRTTGAPRASTSGFDGADITFEDEDENEGVAWTNTVGSTRCYVPLSSGAVDEEEADLPVIEEEHLDSVYFFGGTPVPLEQLQDGAGRLVGGKTGMEINSFLKESAMKFEHQIGDVHTIVPRMAFVGSEKYFTLLFDKLRDRESVGLVRFVGKSSVKGTPDPKLGILWPRFDPYGRKILIWTYAPFAEDVRQYRFPSLKNYFKKGGQSVSSHPQIATDETRDAMDAYIKSMNLMDVEPPLGQKDTSHGWFSTSDSYSPGIHYLQQGLLHRINRPDGPLPDPPYAITKYLNPPLKMIQRATDQGIFKDLAQALDIKEVAKKQKGKKKEGATMGVVYESSNLFDDLESDEEWARKPSRREDIVFPEDFSDSE